MSDYEEVVSLVADINQFSKDLTDAAARYGTFLKEISVLGNDVQLIDLQKKWLQPLLDKQEAMAKINAGILKADEKLATDEAAINDASISKQLAARADAAKTMAAINKDAQNAIIKEDEEAAKVADQLILQQLRTREYELAEEARLHQSAINNWIRREEEAAREKAKIDAASSAGGATLSRGLRAGAGAAASVGNFHTAGAMYGAANVAQMAGVGDLALSTTQLVAFGAAAAGVAVTIGLIAGPGGELNQELAKMSTLLGDATLSNEAFHESLAKTKQAAIDISDKFNIGLIDVVKAFKLALSSGIEADELPQFFEKAGELSNALGTDLDHTTDILTTFKNVYSLTASELGHVNDVLFNTINLGKIEVDGFVKNLGRVLPIAKNAGVGIEDLATSYAVLTSKGVTAAQSTTGLTQLISAVVNPTAKAQKAFDQLGIATGDAAFRGKTFVQFLQEVHDKTGGSADILGQLFPEERAKRVASFLVDSTIQFAKMGEGIRQTGTNSIASGRAMDDLFDNLGKSWKTFWNSTVGLGESGAGWLNTVLYGNNRKDAADTDKMVNDDLQRVLGKALTNIKNSGAANSADVGDVLSKIASDYYKNIGSDDMAAFSNGRKAAGEAIKRGGVSNKGISDDKIMDDASKALNKVNDYLDDIQRKVNDTAKQLSQLPEEGKLSKNEKKELAAKETDEQKQALLDLHELNDELATQIEREANVNKQLEEQAINRLKLSILVPAQDALQAAKDGKDPTKIAAATAAFASAKAAFDEGVNKIIAEGMVDDITERLKAQKQAIVDQINKIESDALTSPTTRASREAAKTEAEKELRDYQQTVKSIYDDDQRAFEKSEKEKEKIQKDSLTAMQRENDRYTNSESSITKEMLQSKLKTGDPDRQRYTAAEARDAARAKLEDVVAHGGDKDEFTKAMQEFKDAAQAVQDAMIAAGYDKDRARKNFQGDLGYLSQEDSQFHSGATDAIARREAEQTRTASYNRKSPEEIAKEAKGQVKKDEAVKEVLVKAQVQLQVDGTLAPETLKKLQDALIDKIEERIVNKSGNPSRYDSSNRGPSNNATPSNSQQHDNTNQSDRDQDENSYAPGYNPYFGD